MRDTGSKYHNQCTGLALETTRKHVAPQDITLFASSFCPFVQRAWVALEFFEIPYKYYEVDPYKKTDELLALSPKGLVPALQLNNYDPPRALNESTVIMEYVQDLAAVTTKRSLVPPSSNPYARALVRLQADHVNRSLVPAFYRYLQTQESSARIAAGQEFLAAIEKLVDLLQKMEKAVLGGSGVSGEGEKQALKQGLGLWVEGGDLGWTDVMVGPWLFRTTNVLKHYRGFSLPSGTQFQGWLERLFTHPAFKATCSTDDLYIDSYERYAYNRPNTSMVADAINSGRSLPLYPVIILHAGVTHRVTARYATTFQLRMTEVRDVESGEDYQRYDAEEEREALLSSPTKEQPMDPQARNWRCQAPVFINYAIAFFSGVLACLVAQYVLCGSACFATGTSPYIHAASDVGSTEKHHFPPASPTNAFPSLFPSDVGYAGGTPTGAEPALVITAPSYPIHTGAAQLVAPQINKKGKKSYDLFKKWGNLSPWYSVERTAFGLDSSPEPPETCRITGLHLLHRHGARYPTASSSFGSPAGFATRLRRSPSSWKASGDLEFLNDWTYKLGEEILTPFGRQQLYDLGVSMRLKYGFLLKNFTESNSIPVFRTESQDRMLQSSLNFAVGFFGLPLEGKYQQSITIESWGVNNTLAPYMTCPNTGDPAKGRRYVPYVKQWTSIYLNDARARLQKQISGYTLSIEDLYAFQHLCAYETVGIGYSKFCELFTEKEWDGFGYSLDLLFWYMSAFGSPVARVQGIGYVQELVARLTHTPITTHNSSTNSTLDDNWITFPLDHSFYVDATHEVVVLNVLTALNLTTLAKSGPLPADHMLKDSSFKVSELAPFATNVQFQLLACASGTGPQIRVIVNDGVVPLTGIKGCPEQKDGMCPVDAFVEAQKEVIASTDWTYGCHGNWTVPEGTMWNTTTGYPPQS